MTTIYFNLERDDFYYCTPQHSHPNNTDDRRRVSFEADALLVSFGLECNTKNYRQMIARARNKEYTIYSVLYDLTGALEPQLAERGYGEFLRCFFADMTWGVSRFLAISEHTRRQLREFCAQELAPHPECLSFPLGCDPPRGQPRALPPSLIGKRFGLYVSTIEARKNHYALYRAFDRALADRTLDPSVHRLVFAGKIGWGVADLIDQIRANPRTCNTILFLNDLEDDEIATLYHHADAFFMPSYDEGYGLPLAEALAVGKVCIASPAGALPEIGGDLVEYVDPLDIAGWQSAMTRWLNAPFDVVRAQERLIQKHHKPTSWDTSADVFVKLLLENAK
jgi:glycosyltransferase involved in cell wall biosynthesis